MSDMELDYDPQSAVSGGERAVDKRPRGMTLSEMASSADASTSKRASSMGRSSEPAQSGTASRILDELLGDMLAIVEDEDDNEDSDGSDSDASISSSSNSDTEHNTLSLQVPLQGSSPVPSEREEGELESDHEVEAKRVKAEHARLEEERRERLRAAKEAEKKKSIERNVSERDVFRYLKKRGFPTKLLYDFTQACISKSHPSTSSVPISAETSVQQPSKDDIRKLSSKHSYKKLLHKAEKLKETQQAVGKLLGTCTEIAAAEEAAREREKKRAKEREREARRNDAVRNEEVPRSANTSNSTRSLQDAHVLKGNYTGRRKTLDKSTETDPLPVLLVASQAVPSVPSASTNEPAKGPEQAASSSNRLPTPTSPTRNGMALDNTAKNGTQLQQPPREPLQSKDPEKAAKAARLAAHFQHALNSRHLNFTKQDLEKFQTARSVVPSSSSFVSAAARFNARVEASRSLPDGARAPLHPALNGVSGTGASAPAPLESAPSSRRETRDPRFDANDSRTNGSFRPISDTAARSSIRSSGSTATSRIIQDRTAALPAVSASMSNMTANALSSDSASSSSANAKSIYELVPEHILQKKKSPNAYVTSLPSPPVGDSQMQVDTTQPTDNSSAARASASPAMQMSTKLPAAGAKGKAKEKQGQTSDMGMWFGSAESQNGVYSPLDTGEAPVPSAAPVTSSTSTQPAPSASVPPTGASRPTVRPIRTSMSPPPPRDEMRHGSAHSPPPPSSSTLSAAPSHLPARPISTTESNFFSKPTTSAEVRKAMFNTTPVHKSANLPRRAGQQIYNDVLSSNEPVALPQKQSKTIDPRTTQVEKMRMLREKERESENSDKEKAGSPHSAKLPSQPAPVDATSTPTAATAQAEQTVAESSASPDSLFEGTDDMDFTATEEPERAFSPPPPSRAQQAANANMPLPSFRKAGQTQDTGSASDEGKGREEAHLAADAQKKQRELDLKNKLKRAREENANTSNDQASNKRQARDSAIGPTGKNQATGQATRDESPPLPSVPTVPSRVQPTTATPNTTAPSSSRKLINSAGRRMSDVLSKHDVEDEEDEPGAVRVAASRVTNTSTHRMKVVPVVEVEVPLSRQTSVASTVSAREGSVDSKVGKTKSVVARKSTGGFRQKPSAPSAPPTASPPAESGTVPAKEGLKVTLKLGGAKSASTAVPKQDTASTPSSSSKLGPANVAKSAYKPVASGPSRTVIEIDDSSDDEDENDEDDNVPLRSKAPQEKVKKPTLPSSSAMPAGTPPSSATRARPRAKPLAGSGKRLSDIGLSETHLQRRSTSTEDDLSAPTPSQAKVTSPRIADSAPRAKEQESRNQESIPAPNANPSKVASPPVKEATRGSLTKSALTAESGMAARPLATRDKPDQAMSSPPMSKRVSASPGFEHPDEEDELIPDSESEAYSPSQMPRYSPSPVPDEAAIELPTARTSPSKDSVPVTAEGVTLGVTPLQSPETPAAFQPEASLNPPAMRMTQVASSQSPEDSQMLRSASENGLAFDEDIDMLANDNEDIILANDLLRDTLEDLPDLPAAAADTVQATVAEVTEMRVTEVQRAAESFVVQSKQTISSSTKSARPIDEMDASTQKAYMDPMDLSQAFGSDEEDAEGGSLTEQPDQGGNMNTQTSPNLTHLQENQSTEQETAVNRRTTASFVKDDNESTGEPEAVPGKEAETGKSTTPAHLSLTTETRHPRRATAADFMASQALPSSDSVGLATEREKTPLPNPALLATQGLAEERATDSVQKMYASPMVPPSETESFEIIMGEQSPVQSFVNNSAAGQEVDQRTRAILDALDKPLEEPFIRCRYGTGCLDMNCAYAHPSPALRNGWAPTHEIPKTSKACADGVFCLNPACIFAHPSPAARRREPCPNQAICPFGVKCVFKHVDEGTLQLTKRYSSYNQSARFNVPSYTPAAPQIANRQHISPSPEGVPGSTVTHVGTKVSTSTLPFLSYHPMPPNPAGTPPLSRSASPAVIGAGISAAGSSATNLNATGSSHQPILHYQYQQQQQQQQTLQQPRQQGTANRSWTNISAAGSNAAGWLANMAGLSRSNQNHP